MFVEWIRNELIIIFEIRQRLSENDSEISPDFFFNLIKSNFVKKCDDGWTLINDQFCVITSNIKDSYQKMTWQEGLSWCKNNYGAVHLGAFLD